MTNGILDPNNFTIAPGSMRSLQDNLLELHRSLPPSLQGPQVGGQPQQTQPEQQQANLGDQINQAAQALAGQTAQQQSQQTGEKPSRKGVQQQLDEYQNVLDQMNPMKPKQAIGGGSLGQMLTGRDAGGILGTGVQPVDVLAFAIGGMLAPKGSSLYRRAGIAMKVGMLPSQFRNFQEGKIKEFAQANLQGINAEIGAANAETAQLKNVQAQAMYNARLKRADIARRAGNEDLALAIESDSVDEYLTLSGGDMPNLPPHLTDELDIVARGGPIPPALRQRGINTPEKARALLERSMARQRPVIGETGEILTGTPEGFVPRRLTPQAQDIPQPVAPQAQAPTTAISPQEPVRRLVPTPGGGFMPPQQQTQPTEPALKLSPNLTPDQQEISRAAPQQVYEQMAPEARLKADLAASRMEQDLGLRMPKELDQGTKVKLLAAKSAHDYANKLGNAYEKMVAAYGGDEKFNFKERTKINAAAQLVSFGGGGGSALESLMKVGGSIGSSAIKEFGGLKTEAKEFLSLYAQAQRFARGAMQDTGNLALNERARFEGMLGNLNDEPFSVRTALDSFYSEIGQDYNNLIRLNVHRIPRGFEPVPTELKRQEQLSPRQPPKWFKPLEVPQTQVQPGGEY